MPFKKIEEQISSDNSSDDSVLKLINTVKHTSIFKEVNNDGNTLLHLCIDQGYIKSALCLINEMNADDLAIKNGKYGNTPLHLAIDKKHTKIIQTLVAKNNNLSSIDNNNKEMPLNWAAKRGLVGVIKQLLDLDSELIKKLDTNGQTVIHWAAKHGNLKATECLLENVKDHQVKIEVTNSDSVDIVNLRDTEGKTALDLANKNGFEDVAIILNYHNNATYFLNLDDSEDEEDTVESTKIRNYNISKKFSEFIDTNKEKFPFNECNNFVLSFITHAAGVYLLYSSKVKKKYYELKQSLKIDQTELVTADKIIPQFLSAIKKKHEHLQRPYSSQKWEKQVKDFVAKNILAIQKSIYSIDGLQGLISASLQDDEDYFLARELLLPRKVLNEIDLNKIETNTDFFAILRFHNRSETRELKNREDKKEDSFHSARKIKWGEDIGESCINKFKYYLKSEIVSYSGEILNYAHIYNQMFQDPQQCILYERILFKHIIPGEADIEEASTIRVFYYHLFGCEAIKNPAAFIHNKMVLDLIEAKKLTWQKALKEQELPMTMKGAIMGSRIINSTYNDFMPHKYLYDKDYTKLSYEQETSEENGNYANLLLKKEINITRKWLEWKLGKSISGYMIDKCCKVVKTADDKKEESSKTQKIYIVDSVAIHAIWGLILESCKEWYSDVLDDASDI